MFSKKGQVETTALIFVIFFFVLTFSFNLDELESKGTEGIRKTMEVMYKDYEVREEELSQLNFVRMHAYNLSENTGFNISGYEANLTHRVDERIDFTYFNVTNSSGSCKITLTLSDFKPRRNNTLLIPECP